MYKPTIGLEIHSELKTETKMFCGCKNDPEEKTPNVNICPICMGHPGTLPVANKKAIELVLKLGMALGATIPDHSKFDRKNYFYPDLPKGYQISQYDEPLVKGGKLHDVRITRVHLEEDAGKLAHTQSGTLVDFNRAGLPLMELVTEPDIKNAKEAVAFAKELQLILRYCGVSYADMEHGQMRVEANISISKDNTLGTKVEVKNLNSFRAVEGAIAYEIKRQEELLKEGHKVLQETRGWDENKKATVSQRIKEEAHDYRYFPEPDLPPLDLRKFDREAIKVSVPELPQEKRVRFEKEYQLTAHQTEILIEDRASAEFFEETISELLTVTPIEKETTQLAFNYLVTDVKGIMTAQKITTVQELKITPATLADLIGIIIQDNIPSRMAKDILQEMARTGLDPHQIIKEKGLGVVSDTGILTQTIKDVIAQNQKAVEDYKKGKENALQFLVGQAMGKLKGQANPESLREEFKKYI